jgi:hypothetical protein
VLLRHRAWRTNLTGIVQAPVILFLGVSKTADLHFKSGAEITS